jgi:formylglycine-generating enzyme
MALATGSFLKSSLSAGVLLGGIVFAALHVRHGVERCGKGWVQERSRCCAPGQAEQAGACTGTPTSCPQHLVPTSSGCVARGAPVSLSGGTFELSATDWDVQASPHHNSLTVRPFRLDSFEVTSARFSSCVARGACPKLPLSSEPGQPVRTITAEDAQRFCVFAGGRLPSDAEWVFAASHGGHYRYPWGPYGLVCRRAAFGLAEGPCASGADGPELAGARPGGATPEGIFDLAGNVAEWTRRPDGTFAALGGSFRSLLASSLKSWNTRPSGNSVADDVGFRCAYAVHAEPPSLQTPPTN